MRTMWAEFGAAALAVAIMSSAQAGETIAVAIDKIAYAPISISAHVGDTVEWTNKDIVAHTATARDKQWDFMIFPGKKQSVVLKRAGTIDYYCRFHPNMAGTITVTE
jgi:plastocyanin